MKKLLSLLIIFVLSINVYASNTVEKTGFYGVYVKSMPFWTFWNYDKAVNAIAKSTQESVKSVRGAIESGMPVLMTWDYQQADQLKQKLQTFNAVLEVREIAFVCDDAQAAAELELQVEMAQLNDKLTAAIAASPDQDLNTVRAKFIEQLKA
jgi:hypothetical protein